MTQRLTQEREAAIRLAAGRGQLFLGHSDDLLAELDAIRAERDEAEQRGRAAERSAAVAYLRALNYEHVPSMLERGDHVRSPGTPPPGAAKDPA